MLKAAFNLKCTKIIYDCIDDESLSYTKGSGGNWKWPFNLTIPGQDFLDHLQLPYKWRIFSESDYRLSFHHSF